VPIKVSSARQGNVPIMIRDMILVSKDKFPLADGKTEKSVYSPKQRSYDNWPGSRFRDEKNPITETTSTLSNKKL